MEDCFDNGHISLTPSGWAYIDDDFGEESEDEQIDMRVNRLGHLFVYDRPRFLSQVVKATVGLQSELMQIAIENPPDNSQANPIQPDEFDWTYRSDPELACAWQEEIPDEDDETSILLPLLKVLRAFAKKPSFI